MARFPRLAVLVVLALAAACSSATESNGTTEPGDQADPPASEASATTAAPPGSATSGAPEPSSSAASDPPTGASQEPADSASSSSVSANDAADPQAAEAATYDLVAALTDDGLGGRDNLSPGNAAARRLLVDELATFAQPAFADRPGVDGYLQPFDLGTNILAIVPGTDLADEYVMIGAHYDSVGPDKCREKGSPSDTLCNGATDNAAGVAAVMAVARQIADDGPPRRSLVVALWDAEEDTLAGSRHYTSSPAVPLADTVAYVNYDIQGSALTPTTADWTVVSGADTGGAPLVDATESAIAGSDLRYLSFGIGATRGRSDHSSFVRAGVPVVAFADGTNGCYHTVEDELAVVDFDKLAQQIAVGQRLVADLVDTDTPPVRSSGRPQPSFEDVSQLLDLFDAIGSDVELLPAGAEDYLAEVRTGLAAVVDGGPAAFDPAVLPDILKRVFVLEAYLTDMACTPI